MVNAIHTYDVWQGWLTLYCNYGAVCAVMMVHCNTNPAIPTKAVLFNDCTSLFSTKKKKPSRLPLAEKYGYGQKNIATVLIINQSCVYL